MNETVILINEDKCIICLENTNNSINIFRKDNSDCKCNYNIHNNCYNDYISHHGNKCMLCKKYFNNNEIQEENNRTNIEVIQINRQYRIKIIIKLICLMILINFILIIIYNFIKNLINN
jgi:hypothetical protein